jgi:hypothetical protein
MAGAGSGEWVSRLAQLLLGSIPRVLIDTLVAEVHLRRGHVEWLLPLSSRVQRQPKQHNDVPHQVSHQSGHETRGDGPQRAPGDPAEERDHHEDG